LIEGSEEDPLSGDDAQVEEEDDQEDAKKQKSNSKNHQGRRTLGKKAVKTRRLIREDLRDLFGIVPKRSHKKRVDRPRPQSPDEKRIRSKVKSSPPLPKENVRDAKNSFNQA
jgi:hypothetical protein